MQKLSWSFSAGASGDAINVSGTTEIGATLSAAVELEPNMAAETTLALQVDDVEKVVFLGVSCSLNDGKVEIAATGDPIPMLGPLVLFGSAVKLFADDLSTLKVQNKSADKSASIEIRLGLSISG